MGEEVYIDLEILASIIDSELNDEYLVRISKEELNSLVSFDEHLVVRHWDGEKPVVLKPYGAAAVRTEKDDSDTNNLEDLPELNSEQISMAFDLIFWLSTQQS